MIAAVIIIGLMLLWLIVRVHARLKAIERRMTEIRNLLQPMAEGLITVLDRSEAAPPAHQHMHIIRDDRDLRP